VKEPALIVAIDGPAGVGKSTVARLLAKSLGVPVLDTGAMYRTVALEVLERGIDPDDGAAVEEVCAGIELEMQLTPAGEIEVLLGGVPVGRRIRTPEVSEAASRVSIHPGVRQRMVELQRRTAEKSGAVLEGRDIGTVVFPRTPYKFFLTARQRVRAERRHRELVAAGKNVDFAEVLADLEERDERDESRANSPLRHDETYSVVDSSDIGPAEIAEKMVAEVRRRQADLAARLAGG
jgi:cytidylate kinase